MMRFLLILLLFILMIHPAQAQDDIPLIGPILATTPAQQNEIILHDLGAETIVTRTLNFGRGELHIWDFSPDGCRILFTLDDSKNGLPKLYSSRLDGSDMQLMVAYDELEADAWGIWEPDWSSRNLIAFTMLRDQPGSSGQLQRDTHIAWINGAGGEPEFYSVTGREFSPQWSFNGEWLAYVSYDERVAGADVQSTAVPTNEPPPDAPISEVPTILEADLWVVSADGETKYRLTNFDVGSMRHPRWSPDDELIGFIYSPSPANDTIWMIANQQGALATQLSYFWNLTLDHTWLPDSSAMVAAVRDFRGTDENRLWLIPLIGNADNDASLYLLDETIDYTDYPRFSPDERFLAFRSSYHLILIDIATSEVLRLDVDRPGNTPPVWSPAIFAGETTCEN